VNLVVRLRIELADRPGSLADVAAVIGAHGGNIVSIDAFDAADGRAIDEITVEVPDELDLAVLRSQIAAATDAHVLSHQRARVVDPIVRVLRRAAEALDRAGDNRAEGLREAVADLCGTPAAWILDPEDVAAYEAGREALAHPGRAVIGQTAAKLPPLGETVTGEASIVAVAVTVGERPAAVLVARSKAQGFTPTEAERVEALVALYARLTGLVAAPRR
jgi:acetolactate synthase regulatory subunit